MVSIKEKFEAEKKVAIDDVKKLTKEAFKECTDEEEGAYTGSQKAIISCICLKLKSDKWAKRILGHWYP